MITEQVWKQKPKKITVIQAFVSDAEALKMWLDAKAFSVHYPEEGPARMDFELRSGGTVYVFEGEQLSRDDNNVITRWSTEAALKKEYKRA